MFIEYQPNLSTNGEENRFIFFNMDGVLKDVRSTSEAPTIKVDVPDDALAISVLLNAFSDNCGYGLKNGSFYINGFNLYYSDNPEVLDDLVPTVNVAVTNTSSNSYKYKFDEALTNPDSVVVTDGNGNTHTLNPIIEGLYCIYDLDEGTGNILISKAGFPDYDEEIILSKGMNTNIKVEYYDNDKINVEYGVY